MLRQIKLDVEGKREDDGSITMSFVLRGIDNMTEATDLTKVVAKKLERAIAKTLKRRGVAILERGRNDVV